MANKKNEKDGFPYIESVYGELFFCFKGRYGKRINGFLRHLFGITVYKFTWEVVHKDIDTKIRN